MPVNLTGLDLSGTSASSTHKTSATPNAATRTSTLDATQPAQNEVSVSSTAALLARLQRSLASTPAVDENRVAAISKAIASGTYEVDSNKIAHGLMDTERALGKLK